MKVKNQVSSNFKTQKVALTVIAFIALRLTVPRSSQLGAKVDSHSRFAALALALL